MIKRLFILCPAVLWLAAVQPAGARPPNILFIITDQQFADGMSCRMGSEWIHTPHMDRLARTGTLFTRAYSTNPLCMPWRNSVFTGRYPHQTGVTRNVDHSVRLDPQEFRLMGNYFRAADYETAYCGKWHVCYDVEDTASHGFDILPGRGGDNRDAAVATNVVKFLARPREKPFLLVVSFNNPHNVCEWARRLAGRQQTLDCGEIGEPPPVDQLPPLPANFAPDLNEPDGLTLLRRAYQVDSGIFPVGRYTEDDWRRLRWGYYRMIEKVDAEIGKVLGALREGGLEENTVMVFTSDHGECAGAHRWNQKTVFYDESARVPLIIVSPGQRGGALSDKLVNTGIDLLPTLLDFAGLEIPKSLPGRSLVPLVTGRSVANWRNHLVVQNHLAQAGQVDGMRPAMEGRMVRTGRFKYCVYSRGHLRESLVDMQADPGETNNLARNPAFRGVVLQHRELLAQFGREQNDPLCADLLADEVKPVPFTARPATVLSAPRNP